jgi:hypothetical protein
MGNVAYVLYHHTYVKMLQYIVVRSIRSVMSVLEVYEIHYVFI